MASGDQPLTRQEFYDAILPNLATKEDLANLKAELIKWMVVTQLLGLGAVAAIITAITRLMGG